MERELVEEKAWILKKLVIFGKKLEEETDPKKIEGILCAINDFTDHGYRKFRDTNELVGR